MIGRRDVADANSVTLPVHAPKAANIGMRIAPHVSRTAQSPCPVAPNPRTLTPHRSPSPAWRSPTRVCERTSKPKQPISKAAQTSHCGKIIGQLFSQNNDAQLCDDRSQQVCGKDEREDPIAIGCPIEKRLELMEELSTNVDSDSETSALTSHRGDMSHRSTCRNVLKLAVFDFDSTLTSFHVFSSLAGLDSVASTLSVPPPHARTEKGQMSRLRELDTDRNWGQGVFALKAFGGESRVARVRRVLEALRNHDVECIILSRGMVGSIAKCLEQVNLLPFFARIVGNIGSSMGEAAYDCNVSKRACEVDNHLMGQAGDDIGGMRKYKSEHIRGIMEKKGLKFQEVVFMDDDLGEIKVAQSTCRCIHVASNMGAQDSDFQALEEILTEFNESDASPRGVWGKSLEPSSNGSDIPPLVKSQRAHVLTSNTKLTGKPLGQPQPTNNDDTIRRATAVLPRSWSTRVPICATRSCEPSSCHRLSIGSMRGPTCGPRNCESLVTGMPWRQQRRTEGH